MAAPRPLAFSCAGSATKMDEIIHSFKVCDVTAFDENFAAMAFAIEDSPVPSACGRVVEKIDRP
jgi:hypothetical protein